jgi:hypothetical protein
MTKPISPEAIRSSVTEASTRAEKLKALRKAVSDTLPAPKDEARAASLRETHDQLEAIRASIGVEKKKGKGDEAALASEEGEVAKLQAQVNGALSEDHGSTKETPGRLRTFWSGSDGRGGMKGFLKKAGLSIAATLGILWVWNKVNGKETDPKKTEADTSKPKPEEKKMPPAEPKKEDKPAKEDDKPLAPSPRAVPPKADLEKEKPVKEDPKPVPPVVNIAPEEGPKDHPADVWAEPIEGNPEAPKAWNFPVCAFNKESVTIDATLPDQRWFYSPIDKKTYNRPELLARMKELKALYKKQYPKAPDADVPVSVSLLETPGETAQITNDMQRLAAIAGIRAAKDMPKKPFTSLNKGYGVEKEPVCGFFRVMDKNWLGDLVTCAAGQKEQPEKKKIGVDCQVRLMNKPDQPLLLVLTEAGEVPFTGTDLQKLIDQAVENAKPVNVTFNLHVIRNDTENRGGDLQPYIDGWKKSGHTVLMTQIFDKNRPQAAYPPSPEAEGRKRPDDVWVTERIEDGEPVEIWNLPLGILRYENMQFDAKLPEQRWFYNIVTGKRYNKPELAERVHAIKKDYEAAFPGKKLRVIANNLEEGSDDAFGSKKEGLGFWDDSGGSLREILSGEKIELTPGRALPDYEFTPPFYKTLNAKKPEEDRACLQKYEDGNFWLTRIHMGVDMPDLKKRVEKPETKYVSAVLDVALHDDKSDPPAKDGAFLFVHNDDKKRTVEPITNDDFLKKIEEMKKSCEPFAVKFVIRLARRDASNAGEKIQPVLEKLQKEGHLVLIHDIPKAKEK